ncbi:MAG: hypothetical protein IT436_06075 [Phycisphaerales bacterium]|nr:hypothetical protein [Phycisphaerales bacterium]
MIRAVMATSIVLAGLLAGGCHSAAPGPVDVAPGQYQRAFEAAKESLRESYFQLDRIDAAAGVITTQAKTTGGLMTPWDPDQSSARQEWEDMLNQQSRVVRVWFAPVDPAADVRDDLRTYTGPVRADIEVVVLRTARPNWRVQTKAVTMSRFTRDPAAIERGIGYNYDVPETRDPKLGARLGAAIRERLAKENAAPVEAAPNR